MRKVFYLVTWIYVNEVNLGRNILINSQRRQKWNKTEKKKKKCWGKSSTDKSDSSKNEIPYSNSLKLLNLRQFGFWYTWRVWRFVLLEIKSADLRFSKCPWWCLILVKVEGESERPHHRFFCNFSENFQNIFFKEHLKAAFSIFLK